VSKSPTQVCSRAPLFVMLASLTIVNSLIGVGEEWSRQWRICRAKLMTLISPAFLSEKPHSQFSGKSLSDGIVFLIIALLASLLDHDRIRKFANVRIAGTLKCDGPRTRF
jgi:hypothetical protein